MATEFAKLIEVTRDGIRINGEDFPWHVAIGASTTVSRDEMPGVTLTILADRVTVDDEAP